MVQDYRDGLFLHPSWVPVYVGQRVMPRTTHLLANAENPQRLLTGLGRLREAVARAAGRLPLQDDYIARYRASPDTVGSPVG